MNRMSYSVRTGRFAIARHLWHSSGVVVLWAGLLIFIMVTTVVISLFRDIEISAWSASDSIPGWYMFGMGIYVTAVYLPMYLAHGITRREFARQALLFGLVLVTVGAALMTLGFAVERLVYRVADWPQVALDPAPRGLYDSADQYGWIFLSFLLTFAVYHAVGAAIAAAFYRRVWGGLGGLLLIPLGLLLITATATTGVTSAPAGRLADVPAGDLGVPLIIAVCVGAAVIATAGAWALIRDLPVRTGRG
ncbi:hypothetical protein [Nocardia sp. NPDC127526]|uniref:hypothetical protein n=1 Tax=Nocardia sp. NPDC127526 TaxID=3345393 RepID=UPI003631A552